MNSRHLALILALGVSPALSMPAAAQSAARAHAPDTEKTRAIRKLMQVTGAGQIGVQVMQQMIAAFKQNLPKVPEKFWQDFLKQANPDELVDLIVPIYDKHLSLDEVRAIIQFYETPAGKKLVSILPQVTQESMAVGQEWGRDLANKVMTQIKEKGLDK